MRDAALLVGVLETLEDVCEGLDDLRDVRDVGSLSVVIVVTSVVVLVVVLCSSLSSDSVSWVDSLRPSIRGPCWARPNTLRTRVALGRMLSMASGSVREMGLMTTAVDDGGMLDVG